MSNKPHIRIEDGSVHFSGSLKVSLMTGLIAILISANSDNIERMLKAAGYIRVPQEQVIVPVDREAAKTIASAVDEAVTDKIQPVHRLVMEHTSRPMHDGAQTSYDNISNQVKTIGTQVNANAKMIEDAAVVLKETSESVSNLTEKTEENNDQIQQLTGEVRALARSVNRTGNGGL